MTIQLPAEYESGFTDFLSCKIDLSKRPFIPRPETEYWAGKAIKDIKIKARMASGKRQIKCLDVFSGSGCIGIAVAKHIPGVFVDFAERETKFLKQIKINLTLNGIKPQRYRIVQSDIFSNIKKPLDKLRAGYDYILANPPYVAESKRHLADKEVLKHEPREALFAGPDGLDIIRKFLPMAKNHLNKDGKIYMEFDPDQKKAIDEIITGLKYLKRTFFKDQYGKWRCVVIKF